MIPLSAEPVYGGRSREAFERVVAACARMIEAHAEVKAGKSSTPFAVLHEESGRGLSLPEYVREGTAVVLRTSGSTGGAKFVELSYEALAYSASATHQALGGEGTWVSCLPSDHIAGFQTVFRSLVCGRKPVFAGSGSPEELAEVVRNYRRRGKRGTSSVEQRRQPSGVVRKTRTGERLYLSLVPTQLQRLLDSDYVKEAQFFDAILVGGAASSPSLLARAREAGLAIRTSYGMTETCGGCVYDGSSLGDTRIQVREGRIHLEGSCVALGYAQGEAFNGGFLSNDYGEVREGKLYVLGRADDAITTGGATIMPQPIEELLVTLGAGEALCVGVPSKEWGQAVIAVTLRKIDDADARATIASRLGREWAPKQIISVADLGLNSLPCTPSGKPSRKEAAALLVPYLKNAKRH